MEATEYAGTIWEGEGEIQPEGGLTSDDLAGADDFNEEFEAQPNGVEATDAPTPEQTEPEEPEKDSDTPPAKSGETAHAGTEPDYRQQIADLFSARPELRGKLQKLPDEVSRAVVENGLPLRTAYAEWEARQVKAENDRIRKEKELFAQQAETASRAPVRGATDGNINETKKPDPFITAFRADRGY